MDPSTHLVIFDLFNVLLFFDKLPTYKKNQANLYLFVHFARAGGTQSGGGAVAGSGDGFSRKTDRRQPSGGQGGASFDYQSNTMDKTDQGGRQGFIQDKNVTCRACS